MSQDEKKKFADYQIDTSEGFESTRQPDKEVYGRLLQQLAKQIR